MNLFDWAHDVELLKAVFSIVIIDLVLSGDNAVVIGMASRRLPPRQQRRAMLFGAGGAIALRVLFTTRAALLLSIPLLEAVGGRVLSWIAFYPARAASAARGLCHLGVHPPDRRRHARGGLRGQPAGAPRRRRHPHRR